MAKPTKLTIEDVLLMLATRSKEEVERYEQREQRQAAVDAEREKTRQRVAEGLTTIGPLLLSTVGSGKTVKATEETGKHTDATIAALVTTLFDNLERTPQKLDGLLQVLDAQDVTILMELHRLVRGGDPPAAAKHWSEADEPAGSSSGEEEARTRRVDGVGEAELRLARWLDEAVERMLIDRPIKLRLFRCAKVGLLTIGTFEYEASEDPSRFAAEVVQAAIDEAWASVEVDGPGASVRFKATIDDYSGACLFWLKYRGGGPPAAAKHWSEAKAKSPTYGEPPFAPRGVRIEGADKATRRLTRWLDDAVEHVDRPRVIKLRLYRITADSLDSPQKVGIFEYDLVEDPDKFAEEVVSVAVQATLAIADYDDHANVARFKAAIDDYSGTLMFTLQAQTSEAKAATPEPPSCRRSEARRIEGAVKAKQRFTRWLVAAIIGHPRAAKVRLFRIIGDTPQTLGVFEYDPTKDPDKFAAEVVSVAMQTTLDVAVLSNDFVQFAAEIDGHYCHIRFALQAQA